jgi:hypothetical protein
MRVFVDFFNFSPWFQISTCDLLQLFDNYHRYIEKFYGNRIGTRFISETFKFHIIFMGPFFVIEILNSVLSKRLYK